MKHTSVLDYRADIDGLRAIAVLSVVFFHAGFAFVPGGFVGVDIFFVISGYLITSQLLQSMERGSFSYAAFYERRIRRLLPAMIPVLLFAIAVALWRLQPHALIEFGDSLVSFFLFASNIFFMNHDSYFDGSSASTLLLHTWSLSVEEQYYLLFPALLLLMYRVARQRVALAIVSIFLLSLVFSIVAVQQGRINIAFYHPLSRFWELMVGSLLAARVVRPRLGNRAANVLAGISLATMAASMALISKATPFPGAAALAPTLATAGIILSGQGNTTLVGRLLSMRAPVFIGRISYSLYLWHWPLLALMHMRNGAPGLAGVGATLLVAVMLSMLSYFFIENPFRYGAIGKGRRRVFVALAVAAIGFGAAGLSLRALEGLPQRFSLDIERYVRQIDRDRNWKEFRYHQCFLGFTDPKERFEENACLHMDPARRNLLIFGDSHAAQLYYGLKTRFPAINFMLVSSFSCSPEFDLKGATKLCTDTNDEILNHWLPRNRVDGLIVTARWENREHIDRMIGQLQRFDGLADNIALVGPALRLEKTLAPMDLIADFKRMDGVEEAINAHLSQDVFEYDRVFAHALAHGKVRYISLLDVWCRGGSCRQFDDKGAPLLMDNNHITIEGSAFVAKAFDAFIDRQVIHAAPAAAVGL